MLSIRSGSSLHAEHPSPSQVEWGSVDGPQAVSHRQSAPPGYYEKPDRTDKRSGFFLVLRSYSFYAGEGVDFDRGTKKHL